MTYEQYWFGDPLMVRAFFKAEKLRQQRVNEEAWLQGIYFYRALDATVGNIMRKQGTTPSEYPKQPFNISDEEREETRAQREKREEQEEAYALAYMTNMVMAGKNWKK